MVKDIIVNYRKNGTILILIKVRKTAKIRKRYDQVPHLTQDTNGKVTNAQLDITNESQEVSPFPAGDHKAAMKRLESIRNTNDKLETLFSASKKINT